jgi:hypothetical protein
MTSYTPDDDTIKDFPEVWYTDEQIEEWNKEDLLEVSNKETFFDVVHYNFWMLIGSIAERLFVRMK